MFRRRFEDVWEHHARAIGIQQTPWDAGVVLERFVSLSERDSGVIYGERVLGSANLA